MSNNPKTEARAFRATPAFTAAKKELLRVIAEASQRVGAIKPGPQDSEARQMYQATLQEFVKDRGRDLYFPFLSSGLGAGMYVELVDGSVKLDMITGIGINFFGHTHPELMSEMINALSSDVMQGNLQPGIEIKELIHALVAKASPGSRLRHAWLMCSGTMSNEVALKIIRQKKGSATKILAFQDCFAGRSTAMQEITDNPGYRQGQPVYGEVEYLPFYDQKLGLEASAKATLERMREHLHRYPGKFAALMIEPVQGEGGFKAAPREWYVRVLEEAKKASLAIWFDEIQSFGRTGEYFAFQKFGLEQYPDVVTVGKMLHACGVIFTEEFNPKPGLVAGTFTGSAVALRTGRRVLELLEEGGFLGKSGKIERLSERFRANFERLAQGSCKGLIPEIRVVGGMVAFQPGSGTMDEVKALLMDLYDHGLVAFYCGHGPILVRMLPPLGAMNEADVDHVTAIVEGALLRALKKAS
jgi:4-aminobutyrate aminotransferase-like enzyme